VDVFYKELLEVLRDRRTLIFMLVMPALIFPAADLRLCQAGVQQGAGRRRARAALCAGGQRWHRCCAGVCCRPGDARRAGGIGGGGRCGHPRQPARFRAGVWRWRRRRDPGGRQQQLSLRYNTATVFDSVGKRVRPLLASAYTDKLRDERLAVLGVPPGAMAARHTPFKLSVSSTADDREELGEKIGAPIPYLLFINGS
jgi:sodium transport system permease protein